MDALLAFLKGPLLTFAVAILVLGLLRHLALSVWALALAARRAGDRRVPYAQVLRHTVSWVFPVTRLHRSLPVFSYASFVFHAGVLLSTFFLREHIDLFAHLGLSWPAIPRPYVDWLALLAFCGLAVLLAYRTYVRQSRTVSTFADYLLLVLLTLTVGMGYVAGQRWNPLPYNLTMVFHIGTGSAILILVPFTKLAHCALYPLVRFSSELGWHLTREGGADVVKTLRGLEGRRI